MSATFLRTSERSQNSRLIGVSLRTLAEQTADDIGGRIARGEMEGGSRLREVEIAANYGVSRAPVREAIRLLARRGLVTLTPRRGAFVVTFSPEHLADLFNIMGALVGFAFRCAATLASEEVLQELGDLVNELEVLAEEPACDATTFANKSWKIAMFLSHHCGNQELSAFIDQQFHHTAWGTVYRQTPDFHDMERRVQAARINRARYEAVCKGDGDQAERLTRDLFGAGQDYVLKRVLKIPRGGDLPQRFRI